MKIVVTFDSLEEFNKHVIRVSEAAVTPAPEMPEPKEAPRQEPIAPEEAAPKPGPDASEDLRVAVRKTLALLNKKAGSNKARELIRALGAEKLTEVASGDLPALMDKAKEALDAD